MIRRCSRPCPSVPSRANSSRMVAARAPGNSSSRRVWSCMVVRISACIVATGLGPGSCGRRQDRVELLVVDLQGAHDPAHGLVERRLARLDAPHGRAQFGQRVRLAHGRVLSRRSAHRCCIAVSWSGFAGWDVVIRSLGGPRPVGPQPAPF
jgi:hypothetical protein